MKRVGTIWKQFAMVAALSITVLPLCASIPIAHPVASECVTDHCPAAIQPSGTTVSFGYDGLDKWTAYANEADAATGEPIRYYLWDPGSLLGFIDAQTEALTVAHCDEYGSVIALTDASGNTLHTAHYGPNGQDWGTVGKHPTPFAWLGGHGVQQVTTSGHLEPLYLTRYRLYSASLNRFLSSDPLGLAGGLNLYAYALGNPLAYIDPLGLCAESRNESRTFISAYVPRSSEPVATLSDGSASSRYLMHANNFVTPPHMWGTPQADALQNITYKAAAAEVAGGIIASGISSAINAARAGKAAAATKSAAGADDVMNAVKLRNQLVGQEIAGGHAFGKHATEFGFKSSAEMATHVEKVMTNPTAVRNLSRGRTAYWDDATQSVVIRNPLMTDGGTTFKPTTGRSYFEALQ